MLKLLTNKTQHQFRSDKVRNKLKKNKSGAGFTIIEATVAMFILIVGIISVIYFFPLSLKIISDSQSRTTASNIASSKIEEIKSLDYEDITAGTFEDKQRISSDPNSYLYNYQRETIVETIDLNFDSSETDLGIKKITVTVFWNSPISAGEKSLQIYSVISNY